MGVICFITSIGIILFQNATTLSFLETIKTLGIFMIIPFFFIVVGINLTVKNLFEK